MTEFCCPMPFETRIKTKVQTPGEYLKDVFQEVCKDLIDNFKNIDQTKDEKIEAVEIFSAINESVQSRKNLSKKISHFRVNISEIIDILDYCNHKKYLENYRSAFDEVFFKKYRTNVSLLMLRNYNTNEEGDFFLLFRLPNWWWYTQNQHRNSYQSQFPQISLSTSLL